MHFRSFGLERLRRVARSPEELGTYRRTARGTSGRFMATFRDSPMDLHTLPSGTVGSVALLCDSAGGAYGSIFYVFAASHKEIFRIADLARRYHLEVVSGSLASRC